MEPVGRKSHSVVTGKDSQKSGVSIEIGLKLSAEMAGVVYGSEALTVPFVWTFYWELWNLLILHIRESVGLNCGLEFRSYERMHICWLCQ